MCAVHQSSTRTVESVAVRDFFESYKDSLQLELVAGSAGLDRHIRERSLNRPALALTGFMKFFASKRIQLFGAGEMGYLRELDAETERDVLRRILQKHIPCILVSRNLAPSRTLRQLAEEFKTPLIRSPLKSKILTTDATLLLEDKFASRTCLHGTLLDVKGIGTLICGESGIGKSECALALIERGHSLVSDDLTYVKRVRDRELMGFSSELNRGYMECRGIGILNIAELFGIRSVRLDKRIDLVINFVAWEAGMSEERTGLEESFQRILEVPVAEMSIPVRPGRDMARLVEVAAMVQALKLMGHDSANEFNERLIARMTGGA